MPTDTPFKHKIRIKKRAMIFFPDAESLIIGSLHLAAYLQRTESVLYKVQNGYAVLTELSEKQYKHLSAEYRLTDRSGQIAAVKEYGTPLIPQNALCCLKRIFTPHQSAN